MFSSSCTVYGNAEYVPLDEKHRLCAVSPYGRTKLMIEDMFRDIAAADKDWRVVLLRYFNPVGAHASGVSPVRGNNQTKLVQHTLGLIGEEQKGIPNNLMPYVQQVVQGRRPFLSVFGSDYNTRDGTCIRDYVHVVDLVEGHVAAMEKLWNTPDIGCVALNLGTGVGTTVLELIKVWCDACVACCPVGVHIFGMPRHLKRPVASTCRTSWQTGARVTRKQCGRGLKSLSRSWAGRQLARWTTCAVTCGSGSS